MKLYKSPQLMLTTSTRNFGRNFSKTVSERSDERLLKFISNTAQQLIPPEK